MTKERRAENSPYITLCDEQLVSLMAEIVLLRRLAMLNEKTELPNARAFIQRYDELQREFVRCGKPDQKITIIYGDLTKFKVINEEYGDTVGDEVLLAVGQKLAEECQLRPGDFVANPHGDSFIILLIADTKKAACTVENRISRNVHQMRISARDKRGNMRTISPSIKLKYVISPVNKNINDLLRQIDCAHYEDPRSF
ncbi:hypothetical protein A2872_00670 [Candidatus Gottesmanbacteria bacterium RIFCSPHIGHO2_01_FULL_42_12]|uniref:GGDEF domain-containing protein n=1 Tax=Candidatus Gottesmanbacteria bacterium RIFCSPHIGHO2_01_FULL_42_12 TaxID=1798377 RepID=A0A1F5Z0A6_9BACT|nr:MAG: hypothetical protein A2872_00670 [Candidatus Gottesmanbacteria bacterium RIFCSPHIGHO2_01_FULL_42_12]